MSIFIPFSTDLLPLQVFWVCEKLDRLYSGVQSQHIYSAWSFCFRCHLEPLSSDQKKKKIVVWGTISEEFVFFFNMKKWPQSL